ncbi:FCD domain-containing protein [Nocardioides sp. 31GB23]|uniref:FadR/GntR family transcriptional regulator n=1 Tax=Nocardioides sp. 31GB23 TaxID=3156065 RepID=UPI0032AFC777
MEGTEVNRSEPPRSIKISEIVARQVLNEIASQGLEVGARLPPEAVMLQKYGVARGSLREALRVLEFQGFIRIRPGVGGGPVVRAVSTHDFARVSSMFFHRAGATIEELFDARMSLEAQMAAHAARFRDPELMRQLRLNVEQDLEQDAGVRDFHDIITGLSGNRVLNLLARSIKDMYAERVREVKFTDATRAEVLAAHRDIANAIFAGDEARASDVMKEHMAHYFQLAVVNNMPNLLSEVIDWH